MATTPQSASAEGEGGGGFIPPPRTTSNNHNHNHNRPTPALPSPAPSTASARAAAGLPRPRTRPLVPGSKKEEYARAYVTARLQHINRRFYKHFAPPDTTDAVRGYGSFDEACRDLEEVVDVLWVSGTLPHFLSVVLAITEYLPSFTPAPKPTFALLKKLDHCFASLLGGKDIRTGAALPGFENGVARGFTRTDMVRLKSLAEETRSIVALHMSSEADVDTFLPEDEDNEVPESEEKNVTKRVSGEENKASIPEDSATPTKFHLGKRKLEQQVEEEEEDDDDDDDDVDDEEMEIQPYKIEKLTPPKRRKTVSPDVKDEVVASPQYGGSPAVPERSEPSTKGGGQFHWALDEDSDVEESNAQQQRTEQARGDQDGRRSTPRDGLDRLTAVDDDEESDGEDEDMYMAVAKVYEKTIVKLGEVLGEAIVDDRTLREGTRCDIKR